MLYNLKSVRGKYLISKFSNDLDLKGSYVLNGSCSCPAAYHSRHCRHKIMKDIFISQGKVDTPWFYDYDTGKWHLFEELEQ
jgi:hypothetical protein